MFPKILKSFCSSVLQPPHTRPDHGSSLPAAATATLLTCVPPRYAALPAARTTTWLCAAGARDSAPSSTARAGGPAPSPVATSACTARAPRPSCPHAGRRRDTTTSSRRIVLLMLELRPRCPSKLRSDGRRHQRKICVKRVFTFFYL